MNDYGVDIYGRPVGSDQIAPNRQSPRKRALDREDYSGEYYQGGTPGVPPGADLNTPSNQPETPQAPPAPPAPKPSPVSVVVQQPQAPQAPQYPTYSPSQFTRYTLPTYQAPTVPTFQAPNLGSIEDAQRKMVEQMLANPETLNASVVDLLNGKIQQDAVAIGNANAEALRTDAVSRGVSDGNWAGAQQRRIADAVMAQMLAGRRDVQLQKVARDREDRLAALAAAEQVNQSLFGRARDTHATNTSALALQEQLNQAAIETQIKNLLFAHEQELGQAEENRFGFSTLANAAGFGENQRQFNTQMGFNYLQLQQLMQQRIAEILNS